MAPHVCDGASAFRDGARCLRWRYIFVGAEAGNWRRRLALLGWALRLRCWRHLSAMALHVCDGASAFRDGARCLRWRYIFVGAEAGNWRHRLALLWLGASSAPLAAPFCDGATCLRWRQVLSVLALDVCDGATYLWGPKQGTGAVTSPLFAEGAPSGLLATPFCDGARCLRWRHARRRGASPDRRDAAPRPARPEAGRGSGGVRGSDRAYETRRPGRLARTLAPAQTGCRGSDRTGGMPCLRRGRRGARAAAARTSSSRARSRP